MKRIQLIIFVIALNGLFFIPFEAVAQQSEKIVVQVFRGWQKNVCPNGYSRGCPRFGKIDFDKLNSSQKLQRLARIEQTIRNVATLQKLNLQLSSNAIRWARRNREFESPDNPQIAIVVVEWLANRGEVGAFFGLAQPQTQVFVSVDRKSYSHSELKNIDPDENFVWNFSEGERRIAIQFGY